MTEFKKYKTLVDNSSDCICLIDFEFKIIFMNSGGIKLNQLTSQEDIIGKSALNGISKEYTNSMKSALERANKGKTTTLEYKSVNKNGDELWWESKVGAVLNEDGELVNLMRVSRDITARKQFEAELIQAREEEEKAKLLTLEIVGGISHDLGNLMTPLKSVFDIEKKLNSIKEEALSEKASKDLLYVLRLIEIAKISFGRTEDMLKYLAKIKRHMMESHSSGVLKKEHVHLYSMAESIIKIYRKMAEDKEVLVENKLAKDTNIYGDFYSIVSIIQNLIHNGIKFCGKGDSVTISADQSNTIVIADTGVGIHEDKLKDIFDDKKWITTAGTSGENGTGEGLHTVQRIMKEHGGSVIVSTEIEKGTSFTLQFPSDNNSESLLN